MSEIGGFEPIPARKRPKKRPRDVREASVPNGGSASVLEGIRRGGLKGQRWTRVRQAYPRWVVRQGAATVLLLQRVPKQVLETLETQVPAEPDLRLLWRAVHRYPGASSAYEDPRAKTAGISKG